MLPLIRLLRLASRTREIGEGGIRDFVTVWILGRMENIGLSLTDWGDWQVKTVIGLGRKIRAFDCRSDECDDE
jgi:hypothetical protein